ncbi:MAG: zinc ribbon domain-containing protein [Promethearchaeota archaeon]
MVEYKGKRVGIQVKRVSPRGMSSYCPRCGTQGMKISEPPNKLANKQGRFFHCAHYQYTADRDYIAAVNIYRMYQQHRKKQYSLKQVKPVSYSLGTGIPPNCFRRGLYPISVG